MISRRKFIAGLGAATVALGFTSRTAAASVVVIDAPQDGTDVTQTILNQIAAAPNGSTIRFPNGARYRCDFPLRLEGRHDLIIEAPMPSATTTGAPAVFWTDLKVTKALHPQVFIGTNSQRQHWVLSNCTGITLRNLRVEGPNDYRDAKGYTRITPPYEAEHAFFFPGSNGIVVEDCSALSPYGDGVFLGAGPTHSAGPNNVVVRRFTVTSCGRTGVGLTRCSNILLDGVTTRLTGTGALSMEPNGPFEYAHDIEIRNCDLDANKVLIPAQGWRPINNVWVHHNTFRSSSTASSWPIIRCGPLNSDASERSHGWTVEDNTLLYLATGGAFNFFETDTIAIRRNSMAPLGKFRAAVILDDCGKAGSAAAPDTLDIVDNNFGGCLGLMELTNGTPTPTHSGNTWAGGTQNDG